MGNKKLNRYQKLLTESSLNDWLYLIKHSYINGERQNQAARQLYRGIYREQSYNLFYISAEEFYKCLCLIEQLQKKRENIEIDSKDLEELSKLFVFHIFKIEGSRNSAVDNIKSKGMIVQFMDKPHLNPVAEGRKMKNNIINSMNKYTSEELFNMKNESIYTGYTESIDELTNPIDNFHFEQPNIMMKIISELKNECDKRVRNIFEQKELERLLGYKLLIGSKHSE